MDIMLQDLAKQMNISISSVRIYMSRPEFSHISLRNGVYYGITKKDLERLKIIYQKRKLRIKKMKTITKYVDYEKMIDINDVFEEEGIEEEWIDLKRIERYPRIRDYISFIEYTALVNKEIDYIVFKLDE